MHGTCDQMLQVTLIVALLGVATMLQGCGCGEGEWWDVAHGKVRGVPDHRHPKTNPIINDIKCDEGYDIADGYQNFIPDLKMTSESCPTSIEGPPAEGFCVKKGSPESKVVQDAKRAEERKAVQDAKRAESNSAADPAATAPTEGIVDTPSFVQSSGRQARRVGRSGMRKTWDGPLHHSGLPPTGEGNFSSRATTSVLLPANQK